MTGVKAAALTAEVQIEMILDYARHKTHLKVEEDLYNSDLFKNPFKSSCVLRMCVNRWPRAQLLNSVGE